MRTALPRWLPVGAGLAFGAWFVLSSAYRGLSLWVVWAPLAVSLTTAAGAVFGYGVDRWRELSGPLGTARRAGWYVAAAAATALVPLAVLALLPTADTRSAVRGAVLLAVTVVGGIPAAAVLYRIRAGAAGMPPAATAGSETDLLLSLRRLLQRLLAAVGSLVALSIVATAAVLALADEAAKAGVAGVAGAAGGGAAGTPKEAVLVFGGAGSLLVALVYAPAAVAVADRGRRLAEELFPLRDVDDPAAVLAAADSRRSLGQLLGADRGVFAELQSGLVVAAPLLASGFAVFLPG